MFKEKSTLFQNKHQTLKKFSHWFADRGYQKFYSMPPKMNFWLKNGHIWPNIGFFGPFDPMPLKKEMWTSCPGGFSVMWVQKLLLPPVRIRIFGLKTAKFGPKLAFLVILGQIFVFLAHFVPCLTKKQCEQDA